MMLWSMVSKAAARKIEKAKSKTWSFKRWPCLSLCLVPTSTLKLHSAEGAAASHDATISCYWRELIVSTHEDDTLGKKLSVSLLTYYFCERINTLQSSAATDDGTRPEKKRETDGRTG